MDSFTQNQSTTNVTLGERVEQYVQTRDGYKAMNGHAFFAENIQKTLIDLAQNVEPYGEDFIDLAEASLDKYLQEGESISAFWLWLKEQGCTVVKVEDGSLGFYAGEKFIDITAHTKVMKITATPDVIEYIKKEKALIFEQTRIALKQIEENIHPAGSNLSQTNFGLQVEKMEDSFVNYGGGGL